MNTQLISKYLQVLRKEHGYTQDDLAEELHVSRQAVSKWEQAESIPDVAILLNLSKLYDITVNEILEPQIPSGEIEDFEEIVRLPVEKLKEDLIHFTEEEIAMALMGASPTVNEWFAGMYPETDFGELQRSIGRVRITEPETAQNQIMAMINLSVGGKKLKSSPKIQ